MKFLRRQPPPWIDLPGNVTANILRRLGAEEILETAQKVCTTWKKVCKDPAMWHVVDLNKSRINGRDFDLMCHCAVDRSQGQLTALSISHFGEDELLNYVAHRSSHLRRLSLTGRVDISAFALVVAVKKLPQLEELHLIWRTLLDAVNVETIGISCPLLNSFTYDEKWRLWRYSNNGECIYNEIALAVAKTMLNLHHLRLAGHATNHEGLEAILDGCPHLESLDLSDCYDLHLISEALRERCSNQIKFIRLP